MGDFTGFRFGNWHSEDNNGIKVVRVSDGDRYKEELQGEIRDINAEVPGLDGEYYFGSTYGTRTIDIDIAFDSLTETQFRELRHVFGTRQIQELVFDERPYKKYLAKLGSPIELSYVCFDEPIKESVTMDGIKWKDSTQHTVMRNTDQTQRIYKGDGTISLICYYPFAKSVFKQISDEESADWAISSGILKASVYNGGNVDKYVNDTTRNIGIINIYNCGDVPTGFRLYIPKTAFTGNNIRIVYKKGSNDTEIIVASLNLEPITVEDDELGILIDTNNSLILGVSHMDENLEEYTTTGRLYNSAIISGYFFKLDTQINLSGGERLEIEGVSSVMPAEPVEPTEPAEPTELAEPTEPTEPTESTEDTSVPSNVGEDKVLIFYDYLYF